jgi:hypothetical protein
MLLILLALIFWSFALGESVLASENTGHEHNHNSSFSLSSLVRPLGITTLCFVSATFLAGLFRRKLRRRFLKIHLPLAIISIILGFTHGILVFIVYR